MSLGIDHFDNSPPLAVGVTGIQRIFDGRDVPGASDWKKLKQP